MSSPVSAIPINAAVTLELPLNGIKLIEASAGTGKTYTITNFYLRHLLEGRSPAEILVVTFTNAATEELRGRIRERIHDALQLFNHPDHSEDEFLSCLLAQRQSLDNEKQCQQVRCLQLALRSMDEAAIYTIHGFCQRALSDHALSSGQAFDTSLLNDDLELWQDALKDWWRRQSYTLDNVDWHLFQSCLGNLKSLLATQSEMRRSYHAKILPEVDQNLNDLYLAWQQLDTELKALSVAWNEGREGILEVLGDSKALSRSNKLPYHKNNLAKFFENWNNYFNSAALLVIPDSLYYLGSSALVDCSTDKKRGSDPDLETGFFQLAQQTLDKIDQIKMQFKVRALIEASDHAQQQVRRVKQQSRSIAFQDQLSLLFEALTGSAAAALGQQLRNRFPVAMIDEFQDTDAIQFGIFRTLYFDQQDISLTMIGDPKQSIYSFRGGDIYTYIKAKQEPSVVLYSLLTNWRSEAKLVNAVNHIFNNRPAPFIYAETIDYRPVVPATNKLPAPLRFDGTATTPLTIWSIPQTSEQKNLSKQQVYDRINEAIVKEIIGLVEGGRQGNVTLGDKPLVSGDIAILVRTGIEGGQLRAALSAKGIRAVTIGRDKVFDSSEAQGLYDLLIAINHFSNLQLVRAALASSLLDFDYLQISEVTGNENTWQNWCEKIRSFHLLWQQRGFIAMFQRLLQELEIAERIAKTDFAQRSLTNLLHLSELCQQQSQFSAGFDSLLAWYRQQINEVVADETELRLESDEDLVKIVTIHKSKGLEYPVVFVPFLWSCRPAEISVGSILKFHDARYNPVLDLGSANFTDHTFVTEKERLAEDIRLAYVAITRARARVYLTWGDVGDGKMRGRPAKTGLAYLLHQAQQPRDLDSSLPWAFDSIETIDRDLKALAEASDSSIEIRPLPQTDDTEALTLFSEPTPVLQAIQFSVALASNWRISSFSSLTRDIHQTAHGGSSGPGEDFILDFPAGSHVGLLLHHVLEQLDFQQPVKSQCAEWLPRYAPRFGLDSNEYQNAVTRWMETLMSSPIDGSGLSLSSLSNQQRLNELAFDFALDELDIESLNSFLQRLAGRQLAALEISSFGGLITGVIDLVFEHEGKYYLADYKSNFLGARLEDYTADKLRLAIYDRRYDLQYLLYSVALHRYLTQRVPDYNYEKHFGGVYYLFIRAMRPQHGNRYGVFFDLPRYHDLEQLDQLLSTATPVAGGL